MPGNERRLHGVLMRGMALFVAFWIFMMPWVVNNSGTLALCDEYGLPVPVPACEEEEVQHALTTPFHGLPGELPSDQQGDLPPARLAQVPCLPSHGEVPHPPPWHRG